MAQLSFLSLLMIRNLDGAALVICGEGCLDHLLHLPAIVETGPKRSIMHDRIDKSSVAHRMVQAYFARCCRVDTFPKLSRNDHRAKLLVLRPCSLQRSATEGVL